MPRPTVGREAAVELGLPHQSYPTTRVCPLCNPYNEKHHITPHSAKRALNESAYVFAAGKLKGVAYESTLGDTPNGKDVSSSADLIAELTRDMLEAADNLEFERAAYLRDQIKKLKKT